MTIAEVVNVSNPLPITAPHLLVMQQRPAVALLQHIHDVRPADAAQHEQDRRQSGLRRHRDV